MDSEDDISILPYPDDDIEVDAGFNPIVPFSPFTPLTTSAAASADVDPGSHYALEKAYLTLKHKLSETTAQNLQLTQKVQELESSSGSRTASSTTTPSRQLPDSFVVTTDTAPEHQLESSSGSRTASSTTTPSRQLPDSFVVTTDTAPEHQLESSSGSRTASSTTTPSRQLPDSFVVTTDTAPEHQQQPAPRLEEVVESSSSSSKTATASTSKTSTASSPRELPESFVVKANALIDQQSALQIEELLQSSSLKTRELDSFVTIGESFDMMEDARHMGESGGERSRQTTQREMETLLLQYKEALTHRNQQLNSLNQQVVQLQEEKRRLQQGWEGERGEKDRALHSLQDLRQQYGRLEQERDKAVKEGASLHTSLKKVSVEMATLREKQGEGGVASAEPPAELVDELTRMRRVIDKLKAVVLMQKDCLVNQSMSMSRNSLHHHSRDSVAIVSSSMEPHTHPHSSSSPSPSPSNHIVVGTTNGGGSGGTHSGHSWEMVNGVTHLPTAIDLRQQQQEQQRSAKMIPVELSPRRAGHPSGNVGKPVAGGNQNGTVAMNIQNGPTPKPRQNAIPRRNSENFIQQPCDSRVEEAAAPRAHTLPQQTPRGLAQWMGSHYQHHQHYQQQHQQAGLNQFTKDAAPNPRYPADPNQQRMGSPSSHPAQPAGVPYPFHEHQQQPSAVIQPPSSSSSTYDNIPLGSSSSASTQGNTGPSMHILNPNSMTGARVLQNNSGSFGGSGGGGGGMAASNPQIPVSVNRDGGGSGGGGGFRGSPQEHSEVPPLPGVGQSQRARNPTDLELNTPAEIRFANELPPRVNLDRKCPVCGGNFSHITMDEFQTHVFECFDDDDDLPSNAPETLQSPGQMGGGGGGGGVGRVCPMCQKAFAYSVSQGVFESHVQSHFEEVADTFEMLNTHRS